SRGSPVPPLRRCTFPPATSTKLSVHVCVTLTSPYLTQSSCLCLIKAQTRSQGKALGYYSVATALAIGTARCTVSPLRSGALRSTTRIGSRLLPKPRPCAPALVRQRTLSDGEKGSPRNAVTHWGRRGRKG